MRALRELRGQESARISALLSARAQIVCVDQTAAQSNSEPSASREQAGGGFHEREASCATRRRSGPSHALGAFSVGDAPRDRNIIDRENHPATACCGNARSLPHISGNTVARRSPLAARRLRSLKLLKLLRRMIVE